MEEENIEEIMRRIGIREIKKLDFCGEGCKEFLVYEIEFYTCEIYHSVLMHTKRPIELYERMLNR